MSPISVAAEPTGSLYDLSGTLLNGDPIKLERFRGNVALVVNTASKCGFTSQYKGLQSLFERYLDRGFIVLGFPSNDFGAQEPGDATEIQHFCERNYGVTFPLFEKASVTGAEKQEIYKFLTERSPGFEGDPGWNFVKFLVDRRGVVIGRFSSMTRPEGKKLVEAIETALASSRENSPLK